MNKLFTHFFHVMSNWMEKSMSDKFLPATELEIYCRFCRKVFSARLERSIAHTGKFLGANSTFEYVCTKCSRSHCFYGSDLINTMLIEDEIDHDDYVNSVHSYRITDHFKIGERITHPRFEEVGIIVGKEPGVPNKILVKFNKKITTFVEDVKM